jgi:2-phosphosulfolactate phosphatase
MKIEILEFVEGARIAKGLTVIIDVFRAFSVACYAYDAGAVKVIATGDVNAAFELRKKYRNAILIGERHEKKISGFDLGNSPTEVLKTDLSGKTVIHSTTAGTNGLVSATGASILLAGSLVNAVAISEYILSVRPEHISLVAMGYRAHQSAEEDLVCAQYIKSLVSGSNRSYEKEISDLKNNSGKRFFCAENLEFSPPTDFFLCTMLNRFSFVLKAERRHDGNIDLNRLDI